jgi:NitT/TauT family transport system permease protein
MYVKRHKFRSLLFAEVKNKASAVIVFIVIVLLWQFESANNTMAQFLLPPPSSIVAEFFRSGVNWPSQILTTLKEILVGFFFGAVGGVALAVLVAESAFLRKTLLPYLIGIEALPKIAIAPLIYILLGFNDFARITMVTLLVFFPVVITTLEGLVDVDRNLVYLMRTLGAREAMILYKVRLPNSTPQLFVGLRLGVLGAIIGSVVAEFVSSTGGLGFLIISAEGSYNTSLAFAALAILAILSLTLYGSIELAAYLTMPWFRKKWP